MEVIALNHITKDYGNQKGVFDASFTVKQGEVMGFLGPNGAGKTTTIRQLMGFIHPDSGSATILGMDCFKYAEQIQQKLGYLPGEIAFMDDMTGLEFLHFIGKMKNISDFTYANDLIQRFELDPKGPIKKMSKGMKQKIGIVCAFMSHPEILILDEPTSGLDPLMQNRFVDLIQEEKKRNTTILMSSHIFEEVEKTCDRAVIIKAGHIMAVEQMETLKDSKNRCYIVKLSDPTQAISLAEVFGKEEVCVSGNEVRICVKGNVNAFIKTLANYDVVDLSIQTQTLEDFFMNFYGGE